MKRFAARPFGLRRAEAGLVIAFGFVLLGNSFATQVSGIVAVSGFLHAVGVNQLLIVWLADYLLIFLLSGAQSLVVDRFDRKELISWVTFGFALVFVLLRMMFAFHAPGWLSYGTLYLVSDQQWLFFPLIFWVLAGDSFDTADAKRVFPVISSLNFVGKLAGIALAAGSPFLLRAIGAGPLDILNVDAFLYLLMYILIRATLGKLKLRRRVHKHESMRATLGEGLSFVREVPAFRFLTFSIIAMVACDLILEFRFYAVSDAVFRDASAYQLFYSLYRLGFTLAAFAFEGLFAGRIIRRLGLKNSFLILPLSAMAGAILMTGLPGIASAVAGVALQKLPAGTIDETARKEFQTLVPEERRGRVSILMDSYLFAVGSIIGSAVAGAVVLAGALLHAPLAFYGYLAAAIVAAMFSLWSISKMRSVYEASMLNWRLKRRQRAASVLDKLTF